MMTKNTNEGGFMGMIDDLLLQEVFSLRQKVLILAELLAKHEPELCISGLLHDIGTEDYRISAKNTEQANQPDSYITDFLEYCEIMKLKPTVRDQIIFMAGMTFQSLKQRTGGKN